MHLMRTEYQYKHRLKYRAYVSMRELQREAGRYSTWWSTTIPMSGTSYLLTFCHPFACYSVNHLLAGKTSTKKYTAESQYNYHLVGGKQEANKHKSLEE